MLRPDIKRMVHFAYLNLVESGFPSPETYTLNLDLILCRNVLIYFSSEFRCDFLRRLAGSLQPGGLLLVGLGETASSEARFVPVAVDNGNVFRVVDPHDGRVR